MGEEDARSRWYFRRKRSARMMKLRRATPPIAPPTLAPVLLGLADVDGWEAVVAPERLSELLVESVVGCFVLGVGVVDCDSESVVVEPVVEGGTEVGVELGEGVDTTVTVTDDAAWVCEIVFAA
jgi:hypothetical protein